LMREAAELATPTSQYFAAPLEENLFEWHFTVRGPEDSDFEDGVYHGRIIVPSEYPMKPPDIIILTPNGRFVVGQKICLSISGHHPETWQPSWSIRTALLAIIGFMPTPGKGTIGSLDYTPQERKILAKRSLSWSCDKCGVNPASLLLPANQESTTHKNEVEDIVKSVEIKGEDTTKSGVSTEGSEAAPIPTLSSTSQTEPAASAAETAATAATTAEESATVSPDPQPNSNSSNSSVSATSVVSNSAELSDPALTEDQEAPEANGFQVYDVIICIIVLLIAILLFRKFAFKFGQEMEVQVDDNSEDISNLSE